jgi:hypothetical protein
MATAVYKIFEQSTGYGTKVTVFIHEKEYKFIISGGATDGSFMFIVA